jgi:hypothetical protein
MNASQCALICSSDSDCPGSGQCVALTGGQSACATNPNGPPDAAPPPNGACINLGGAFGDTVQNGGYRCTPTTGQGPLLTIDKCENGAWINAAVRCTCQVTSSISGQQNPSDCTDFSAPGTAQCAYALDYCEQCDPTAGCVDFTVAKDASSGDASVDDAALSCTPGNCAITFDSGPDWPSYTGTVAASGSTFTLAQLQGPAREVCLTASDPPNCPAGALLYNVSESAPQWTGGDNIPSAYWIWRSDTALTSPGSMQVAIFEKTFAIGPNATGSLHIAADDFAAVFVNNVPIGTVGSTSDVTVATSSHTTGTMLDLTPALQSGTNVVTIAAQNGPFGCSSTCPYSANPAGVVFEGTLSW